MTFEELLARASTCAELSDDDLAALEAELLEAFDRIRKGEDEHVPARDVERLQQLVDAVEAVRGEAHQRIEAAEEQERQIAEMESKLHPAAETPTEPEPDDGDDGEEKPPSADAPEPVEVEAPAPAPEPQPEPVAAAAEPEPPRRAPVAALAAHGSPPPEAGSSPARVTPRLLAVPGNFELHDREGIAREVMERLRAFERTNANFTERVPVARIRYDYPEERDLRGTDLTAADEKIDAVVAGADRPEAWQDQALVASGGFCAPLEVDYGILGISEDFRPIRDSLPRFAANRGGLRFTRAPSLSSITVSGDNTDASAAVSVWTADNDESPGENTKGVQTIACGTVVDVELQAIVKRLQFGNFQQMAYPEWVANAVDLTSAAHARQAETELLDQMSGAAGVLNVTTAAVLGLSRDLLAAIDQAAAGFRSRHRMRPDAMLHVDLPAWVVDAMRTDVVRQAVGDGNGQPVFAITEANVRAWLSARNINVTFYVDTTTGGGQVFAAQGEPSDLRNWPTTVIWSLYPEGAFTFLDGGELDLGIVRDSTLNDTNDFQMFAETFEAAAFRGPEALFVTSTVCPNGDTQVGTDNTGSVCSAS